MHKDKKIKVLFVRPYNSSFIERDFEILEKHFDIKLLELRSNKKKLSEKLKILVKIFKYLLWADITFSWFADIHTFRIIKISKIIGRKSIVVIGGYEVAEIPEISYGGMVNSKSASIVKYILNNADVILTVDEGLKIDAIRSSGILRDNILTIPTGYDHEQFRPKGEKENLIITVASVDNWERARLKGVDIFVESAKFLPDFKFIVIGIEGDALKKLKTISPPNLNYIMKLPQEKIIAYYQKAKIYCQLSMREGLPNALCEAMLCECIPVGSDVQGVRTAIGDAGFLVPYGDVEATAETIIEALKSNKGKDARERIIHMFPEEKREKELVNIIKEVL